MPKLKSKRVKATYTIKFTADELIEIRDDLIYAHEHGVYAQRTFLGNEIHNNILDFIEELHPIRNED